MNDTKSTFLQDLCLVAKEWTDENERLRALLMPHVCLCQQPNPEPTLHDKQCPYRVLVLGEPTA